MRPPKRSYGFGRSRPPVLVITRSAGERRAEELGHLQKQQPQRRNGGQHRHVLGTERHHDLLGDRRALDDERRARTDGAEELVTAVIEAEREQARDAIITADAEIARHRAHSRPDVRVRDRHALWEPG